MAINNWNNFIAAGTQEPWYATALEDALKGYKMGKEPAKMAEEQKQREATTKLKTLEAEHKPKEFELSDEQKRLANALSAKANSHYEEKYGQEKQLRQAQINKANRPSAPTGALAQAFSLKEKYPEGSPERKQVDAYIDHLTNKPLGTQSTLAKLQSERDLYPEGSQKRKEIDQLITKTITPSKGIQVSTNPEGGTEVSIGGQDQGTYIDGLGKLPQGSTVVYSKDKVPIGVNERLTPKEYEKESATRQFGVAYPFINKSLSEYSGRGSNLHFEEDLLAYETDPAAKARIDNYDAAKKLLSIGKTQENARIGGHATNTQLEELGKTLNSAEINTRLVQSKGYQLPKGYLQASGDIFKQKLDEMTKAGQNIPYQRFRPIDEKQAKKVEANKKLSGAIKQHGAKQTAKEYYLSLSPEQRLAYKQKHLGGG